MYTNWLARRGHCCVGIGFSPASTACAREQAKGLFSEKPHLCLQENFWDTEANVAIERYYVVDVVAGKVARHSASTQAYTNEGYRSLLAGCGFGEVVLYPTLGATAGSPEGDLIGVLAQKSVA